MGKNIVSLSAVALFALTVTLAGCGKKEEPAPPPPPPAAPAPEPVAPAPADTKAAEPAKDAAPADKAPDTKMEEKKAK